MCDRDREWEIISIEPNGDDFDVTCHNHEGKQVTKKIEKTYVDYHRLHSQVEIPPDLRLQFFW